MIARIGEIDSDLYREMMAELVMDPARFEKIKNLKDDFSTKEAKIIFRHIKKFESRRHTYPMPRFYMAMVVPFFWQHGGALLFVLLLSALVFILFGIFNV